MHYEDLIERLRNGATTPMQRALMNEAADAIEKLQKEFRCCQNELCVRCGNYTHAVYGACDGCRWGET